MQKALLLSRDELLTFCLYDICAPVRSTEMQTMLFLTFDLYIFRTTSPASKQILLLCTRYVEHRPLLFIMFTYSSLQTFAHLHNPSSDICILVRWVRFWVIYHVLCCQWAGSFNGWKWMYSNPDVLLNYSALQTLHQQQQKWNSWPQENGNCWSRPAQIKHWSGLVSKLEMLMSDLHFVI